MTGEKNEVMENDSSALREDDHEQVFGKGSQNPVFNRIMMISTVLRDDASAAAWCIK